MRIELFDHPFESGTPQVFEAESIGLWLLAHYGDAPAVRVQVFAGEPSAATEVTGNVARLLANDADYYTVLESPAGMDPISWTIMAIALILAVTAVLLMPKPSMPSNVNRTQQSPNNSLTNRNNQLRMLERVEDIYGVVRAIPSLMMPTYNKYIDNRLYEYGYYCVSRGYIECDDIRDADTLIADIDGASAAVYYPFSSPNTANPVLQIGDPIGDPVLQARRAEEVDGITLKAPNQVHLPTSASYDFTPNVAGNIIAQHNVNPNFNALGINVGDPLTVSMTPDVLTLSARSATVTIVGGTTNQVTMTGIETIAKVGWILSFTGFGVSFNNNPRPVVSVTTNQVILGGALMTAETQPTVTPTSTGPDLSGSYTVAAVSDSSVRLQQNNWTAGYTSKLANVQLPNGTEWSGWFTVPDIARNQIWANIVAAQGLYKDSGSGPQPLTVTFEMQIERLNADLTPTGSVQTGSGSIYGSSSDEYAVTFEQLTTYAGPARVRMRRSSDHDFAFTGSVIDEIKWIDLYAVTPVANADFGNKTTIHTVTKATVRATSLRNRQVNCLAYRLLPVYDGARFSGTLGDDGRLVEGTLAPTARIADIIAAVSLDTKIGRRTIAEIDMPQIYATNEAIMNLHPEAGTFNYTFDSDSISYEETVTTIANAAFCIAYRQNGLIRLAFDQQQDFSTALFTHRNKKPNSDTITRKFASDSEYDGVEFVYQDPDTETSETIVLPLDGSYTKLKKFEIPGIRSFAQAWLRANREYYKLVGQRLTLKTETTGEGRALLPNTRIDVADNTRYQTYDGEIVGQSGLEVFLSRDVIFTEGESHSLVFIRRSGELESIAVSPGSQPNSVMLAQIPTEALVTDYGPDGIRTIFSFAADSARDAMAWLVQEIDQSDPQFVSITAINYSADYYQMDGQPIPSRDAVINA